MGFSVEAIKNRVTREKRFSVVIFGMSTSIFPVWKGK